MDGEKITLPKTFITFKICFNIFDIWLGVYIAGTPRWTCIYLTNSLYPIVIIRLVKYLLNRKRNNKFSFIRI